MAVMLAMGASPAFIKRIFLAEGCLLAGTGALIGIFMATILCLLQQHVGLIPMPGKTFLIKYYPVDMQWADFAWVGFAVIIVSGLASWAPASRVARQAEEVIASMKRF
jgi:lipoprotein-releasing system permease protein